MRLQYTNIQRTDIQIHYGGAFLRLVQLILINYVHKHFFQYTITDISANISAGLR